MDDMESHPSFGRVSVEVWICQFVCKINMIANHCILLDFFWRFSTFFFFAVGYQQDHLSIRHKLLNTSESLITYENENFRMQIVVPDLSAQKNVFFFLYISDPLESSKFMMLQ
jgi:hypothetical protein